MPNIIGFAALGVGVVAFVLSVVANSLPYWASREVSSGGFTAEVEYGLWRSCITFLGVENCDDTVDALDDDEEIRKMKVVRAMVIIGIILNGLCWIPFCIFLFVKKEMKMLGFVAGGAHLAAGIFLMIGMAIFENETDSDADFGSSFALVIVAWILSWVAGGLMLGATVIGGKGT